CQDRVLAHRRLRPPIATPSAYYVLLEVEDVAASGIEPWIEGVLTSGLAIDGTLAQHGGEARDLWALREGISESLSATGLPHKNDVALPIARLSGFCAELDGLFASRYPGW